GRVPQERRIATRRRERQGTVRSWGPALLVDDLGQYLVVEVEAPRGARAGDEAGRLRHGEPGALPAPEVRRRGWWHGCAGRAAVQPDDALPPRALARRRRREEPRGGRHFEDQDTGLHPVDQLPRLARRRLAVDRAEGDVERADVLDHVAEEECAGRDQRPGERVRHPHAGANAEPAEESRPRRPLARERARRP